MGVDFQISANRIADVDIYKNNDFYKEPKEYFKLVLSEVEKSYSQVESLLDIGCANGSFLFHAQKKFNDANLVGAEPIYDLAEIARQNTRLQVYDSGLFELEDGPKYQVVTMLGVLGIFFDVANVLSKMRRLLKDGGAIFILSPFNDEDIDVILNYRRAPGGVWESGHNLFSKTTMEFVANDLGMRCEWVDFEMSNPIPKTNDPMRSWTESFRNNKNQLIYGTNMFVNMKLLIVR
jgi:SAM-dependent methyltransferase